MTSFGATNNNIVELHGLSTWVKDKEKISSAFENGKSPKPMKLKGAGFDSLDKVIYKWFMNARERNVPVSGTLLKEKAVFFQKSFRLKILKVLMAGLIAGKQGTVSRLRRLLEKQNRARLK